MTKILFVRDTGFIRGKAQSRKLKAESKIKVNIAVRHF